MPSTLLNKSDPANFSLEDWVSIAEDLEIQSGLFINGNYVSAKGGETFDSINPANGEVNAKVASASDADVDAAVSSCKAAWDDGRWRHMPPRERMNVLLRLADLVDEHAGELALLDSLDMGKPITDCLTIDIPEVSVSLRFFAECIDKVSGSVTNTENNALHMIHHEPLGIVGAISAWNYPLLMAIWKVAPALAAGNCVVLKPSEQAPLSCTRLAQLFIEAGGPVGVFNVVNGYGHIAGKALALHMDVAKISFTGSTAVGKKLMMYSGESNLKRVALETGGKSPQIFMPDLADLDQAVDIAIAGIYDNVGQVCNAGSRLLVHKDIHDAFVEKFIEKSREVYQPGNPLDPATSLGPMVSLQQRQGVLEKIEAGNKEGAKLAFGGEVPSGLEHGAYIQPALFTQVTSDMSIAQEEIFGPVVALIPFDDEAQALKIANDSKYGLAAGLWTSDLNTAHRMTKSIEAGVIWVNCFGDGDMTQPFGGYKQSGNSRDKSLECFTAYTQSKSTWINLA